MTARITGLVGVILVVVFLGYYVISIRSIPLSIIMISVLVMMFVDFYQSTKRGNGEDGSANPS